MRTITGERWELRYQASAGEPLRITHAKTKTTIDCDADDMRELFQLLAMVKAGATP